MTCTKGVQHTHGIKKFLIMQKKNILCFSSPFDSEAVQLLKNESEVI